MARRRRKPLSPTAWFIGVLGSIISAYLIYQVRVAAIENMAANQIARAQAVTQQLQRQQVVRQEQQAQAATRARLQQHEELARATEEMRRRSELEERKRDAWKRFYQEPRGCDVWRSDQHMVECQNQRLRAKSDFERRWKDGEFGSSEG